MGQVKTQLERNTFVKGLVTEASPIAFPENASTDERNFVLNRDGSRRRRLGMDLETGTSYLSGGTGTGPVSEARFSTYRWSNVGGDPTREILVVRLGNRLWFHENVGDELGNTTRTQAPGFGAFLGSAGDDLVDFATIDGTLIIVSSAGDAVISYSPDGAGFDIDVHTVTVRDLWGLKETSSIISRPTTLSDEHKYNLLNQGWPDDKITATYGPDANAYPSNADIPWIALKDDGTWDESLLNAYSGGFSSSPRGRAIIDAFFRGRSRETTRFGSTEDAPDGTPYGFDFKEDEEQGSFSAVESFSGRLFYAAYTGEIFDPEGTAPRYTELVFFTQVVNGPGDYGKCYQEADPTALDSLGLVDTDGGFIRIGGAGRIYGLRALGSSILVFAENGIWQISGPDGVFSALSYSVEKISNVGPLGIDSVVVTELGVVFCSKAGIQVLAQEASSGRFSARNLIDTTIQSFYDDIPVTSKVLMQGRYDRTGRKIRWLFSSVEVSSETYKQRFDSELVYDMVLEAWTPYYISSPQGIQEFVIGYADTGDFSITTEDYEVLSDEDTVVVGTDTVVLTSKLPSNSTISTKYLAIQGTPNVIPNYAFSYYGNADWKDWGTEDAVAYLETGHELFGDTQRNKQANYLTLHFERTEDGFVEVGDDLVPTNPSGCLVQAKWDFANSTASGKIGRAFQGYRLKRNYIPAGAGEAFDYGWEVVSTKNKLRGSGRSLKLRFDTEEDKDCVLLGWAMDVGGRSNV